MRGYLYSIITDSRKGLIAGIIKFFLFCLSLIYSEILRIILACYKLKLFKTHRLSVKVISVGNITWGGTGKTPLVEFIARYLIKCGQKIAILTRGYGRPNTSDERRATSDELMGDEPYLLKQKLNIPVIVDGNRRRSAELAKKEFNVDTVVLDDGFQQFSIYKELNILTIDALNPFGNFMVIPRGILREPLTSIIRADIIIISKANLATKEEVDAIKKIINKFNKRGLILEAEYSLTIPSVTGNRICILTSIAAPLSFKKILLEAGFIINLEFNFSDHYHFKDSDIDKIIAQCKAKNTDRLFTTEKDWVRLEGFEPKFKIQGISVEALPLEIKIKDENRLFSRLNSIYLD